MESITIQTYSFLYDKKATEQAYHNFNTFCVEQCSCSFCENFNASRNEIYTADFLKLLHKIGIIPGRKQKYITLKFAKIICICMVVGFILLADLIITIMGLLD